MAYHIVAIPMTLSDLQGHSHIVSLFNVIFRTVVRQLTIFSTDIPRCAVPV